MTDFILSEDEWYRTRDDRTRRVDGSVGFENFSLGVIINPKVESNNSIKVMAITTLNILARWCRSATIKVPTTISYQPDQNDSDFRNALKQNMSKIDPYGQFTFGDVEEDEVDQVLVIGQLEEAIKTPHVWIDGSGWIAGVGHGINNSPMKQHEMNNPVGPAFASCLGVAEIFRQSVGYTQPEQYSIWYSLYDFNHSIDNPNTLKNPNFNNNFDFGRIYQVGCGAVGSSVDYLISMTDWKGELVLIDFDEVDVSNCNRSLSFNAYDAVKKRTKIDSCADVLKSSEMTPTTFMGTYDDFITEKKMLDEPPDLILCLANEYNVWSNIQHNFPPLVLHATTTPNWGINFGRHIPKKEWCILCRFSQEIEHKFIPPCGEGEISTSNDHKEIIQGVLPFLSPTSAVFVLAEMAKMSMSDYPVNDNFIQFSMKIPKGIILPTQRNKIPKCLCIEQHSDLYPKEIIDSKFWKFAERV